MTWPSWLPRLRVVRAAPTSAMPGKPGILATLHISNALQLNNAKPGSRAMHRVCAGMQQKCSPSTAGTTPSASGADS